MIRVRPMTADDLPLGLRLSEASGWNQVEADWQRFLDLQPDGCFVAEYDGTPVGTTTTCIFDSVAWIAMVLVEEAVRGRGVGTELMRHAVRFLDGRGVTTVRLDARPMGRLLYERLGFVQQYEVAHYEGPLLPASAVTGVEEAASEQWDELLALDEKVTGTDRRWLLLCLFTEHPEAVRVVRQDKRIEGFLTSRPGRQTLRLGPCVASAGAGPLLFADACHRHAGRHVSLDVPVTNEAATRLAEGCGLTVRHTLTRMCRGDLLCEGVQSLWANSGPEKG